MKNRIALAADDLLVDELLPFLKVTGPNLAVVKVHNLYDEYGPPLVGWLRKYETRVWIDAKLHDIPATVAKRAAAFKKVGADILTVHASGGVKMMKAAVEHGPAEIFAVTVLTSLDEDDVRTIYNREMQEEVDVLFRAALEARVHGVVCSPQEVVRLLQRFPKTPGEYYPKIVTPGIRPAGVGADDQARIATPGQAVLNGSDLLVIGRPITQARNPLEMIARIEAEVQQALSEKEGV